jgi:hypothetical protein
MVIKSDGKVGIGTSSPAAALDVTSGEIRMTDGRNLSWGGANCRIQGTNAGAFQIFAGGAEQVRVDTDGLKFNGDTAAANALDDYEEGTCTLTLIGSTAGATTPVTTTANYTKIGRTVTLDFNFTNVNMAGATGSTQITGVPFGAAASTGVGSPMKHAAYSSGTYSIYYLTGTILWDFYMTSTGGWAAETINATTAQYYWNTVTYRTSA